MNLKNSLISVFALSLISMDALAAPAEEPNFLVSMAPLIIIFVIFYFMLIRPQSKKAKEHKSMTEGLQKGDEILTQGGVLGKITEAGENFVSVEVATDVVIKVQRAQVGALMPKGTMKSA